MKQQSLSRMYPARMADERGSLALEQVLFIGAIVALSAGLFVFYDNLSQYFSSIGFAAPPTGIGGPSGAAR